ncbi:MAG: hypothetical protein SPF51_02735 [Candidatus Fimivicinus sp.]|nr:hypothetical protein [Oscillospiraceae bacterium]MDY5590452.1 hypothetical protein [Candidatus Fimivicinus sp.]
MEKRVGKLFPLLEMKPKRQPVVLESSNASVNKKVRKRLTNQLDDANI